MLLKYARKQRASVFNQATIDDLPFEVLRKAFIYLEPADLVSPSRVNRSWRPAAQDVQRAKLMISPWDLRKRLDASFMCGIQLSRIVFGYEAFSIKHLCLDLRYAEREFVPILTRLVASTLRNLELFFNNMGGSIGHFAILDQFFSQCNVIRNLKLQEFDFGFDPASISLTIKDGFYRLSQLSIVECRGDLRMFVVSVPILNLHSFSSVMFGKLEGDEDILSAVAIDYPTIKRLSLVDSYDTSATLLIFAVCCREIEELSYCDCSGAWSLDRRDIEAIASLPRLRSLIIDNGIAEDAVLALSRCRGLKHLALYRGSFELTNILPALGRNLVSLKYRSSNSYLETVNAIIEHCPNLHWLDLNELDALTKAMGVFLIKGGLKKLSKLKLNGITVFLGTDWEGYRK
jgi:hypothetical protein